MDGQSASQFGGSRMRAGDHPVVHFFTTTIPLFSALASCETCEPYILVLLGLIVYVAQHIGFLINPHFQDVLGYILGGDVANVFYGFHVPLYDPLFVYNATSASLIGLVFVTFALGLALVVMVMLYRSNGTSTDKQNPITVYANRLLIHSMSTVLLIPMLQICFAGMVCGEHGTLWHFAASTSESGDAIKCWGSGHLATFIPSALFVCAIVPLLYWSICCQFENRNGSDHLKARRHSLVDELAFAHDLLSCLLFQVLLAYDMRGAFMIVHCVTAAAVAAAYAYCLPFHDMAMNQLLCATHATEATISVILAAALLNKPFAVSMSASVLILGLVPFAVLYAVVLATYRVNPEFLYLLQRMKSEKAPAAAASDKVAFPNGLADDQTFPPFPDLENQVVECITRQDTSEFAFTSGDNVSTRDENVTKQREILAAFVRNVRIAADVELATSFVQSFERHINERPSLRMHVFACKIFSRGLVTFPVDSLILYRFASYIVEYIPTMSFIGLELIENMSLNLSTSVVLRYRAYHTAAELRLALGIRNQAHLLHSNKARSMHCSVLSMMHNFWMKLTEPSVNIGQVSEIADNINVSRHDALAQFRRALQHQTSSDAMLVHRLGDFLRDVMMDTEGATECYNEAKEIHEARQARSMRGTKQHTTVELDVETLTERLLYLLEGKREGGAGGSMSQSSVVQYLLISVTVIFAAVVAVVALFLYVAVDQRDGSLTSVDRIRSTGVLRQTTPSFAADVLAAMTTTTVTARPAVYARLEDDAAQFATSLVEVTSGDYKSQDAAQVEFLTANMVPTYLSDGDGSRGYALWTLAEALLAHMKALIQLPNTTALLATNLDASYVIDAADVVGRAFDHLVNLTEEEVASQSRSVLAFSVALFAAGAIVLLMAYVVFLVSFRRTALGRVFTFQLFTLIPFDDLEKLATDTKEKVQVILDEKRSQSKSHQQQQEAEAAAAAEDAHVDDINQVEDADGAESEVRRGSTSQRPPPLFGDHGAASGVTVKSCLKKATAQKTARKVTFNQVVETIGGKDDDAEKSMRKGEAHQKRVEDGGDQDEPLLLEKRSIVDGRKQRRDGSGYSAAEKSCFMVAFGGMMLIGFALMVLLGVGYGEASKAGASVDNTMTTRVGAWRELFDKKHRLDEHSMHFLFSGHLTPYNLYVDVLEVIQLKLIDAIGVPSKDVGPIVVMKRELEQLKELHLDCMALAANHHGTRLNDSSLIRSRVAMHPAAFSAAMQLKYPQAYQRTRLRTAGLNVPVTDLELAWSMYSSAEALGSTSRIDASIATTLTSLRVSAKESFEAGLRPPAVVAALALCCVCAMMSVVMMVPNIELLTANHVGRVHFMVLALLFTVPIGLMSSAITSGNNAVHTLEAGFEDVVLIDEDTLLAAGELRQTQLYAVSGETKFFFATDAAEFQESTAIRMMRKLKADGLVTDELLDEVDKILKAIAASKRIANVARALVVSAFSQFVPPEPSMVGFLGNTTWWYAKEPDYRFMEQLYPHRTPKYSTRAADLALSPYNQSQVAIASLLDSRMDYYTNVQTKNWLYLVQNVSAVVLEHAVEAAGETSTLLIAAIASCAAPLCWCFYMCVKLGYLFTFVMGLQANTNTNSMDTSVYTVLIQRCQYALLLLVVLLGVTFGVGIWVSATTEKPLHQLNLASQRNYMLERSLMNVRLLFTNVSKAVSASLLFADKKALLTVSRSLYFGPSDDATFYTAGSSAPFDELTFGPSDVETTDAVMQSYYTDVCSALILGGQQPFAARGPFGSYAEPTQLGIFYWRLLLGKIAVLAGKHEMTSADWSKISEYHAILSELRGPLVDSLTDGETIMYTRAKDQIKSGGAAFIAVAAITLAAVVIVYVLVVLPTVQRLVDEEESAKLLLRMIPLHVRDQVPAISEFIDTGKIDNAAELQKKFEASEKLLSNILPQKIANRLKSGEQPIADTHPCLTILFTDFVGFTKRSSNMRADEIVDFLNEVFLEFDTIVELLELEKIKTIGDAYFMAGGLDPKISDHAMRVIEAGYMFFQALDEHNARHPDRNPLQMRLGIHTGPAVAGVIGTKKVAYDLWGESVEIANAMESTGIPGRVHISEDTAKHVKGFYKLEPRGELPREKEHIPDCMPDTHLICGRLLPTPYQHIQRPRMLQAKLAGDKS